MTTSRKNTIAIALALAMLLIAAFTTVPGSAEAQYGGTMCTMDAKLCPDGSYVGRTGPNCEFVCPGDTIGTENNDPDATNGYWTPERMQNARPLPWPTDISGSGSVEIDVEAGAAGEGDAGGTASGSASADGEASLREIPLGDILVRILNSSAGADFRTSAEAGVTVSEEIHADDAVAYETEAADWFGAFVLALQQFFFGWWGGDGDSQNGNTGASLDASVTDGPAPLTVRFTATVPDGTYYLNVGDGVTGNLYFDVCTRSYPQRCVIEHTFTAKGTYTVQLIQQLCPANAEGCLAPDVTVDSVTITVGGDAHVNTDATFSATPTSGTAPLTVRFSSTLAEPSRYSISFGDGTSAQYEICASSYPERCSLDHTYARAGTYTAVLVEDLCPPNAEGCLAPTRIVKSITITVR